MSRGSHLIGAGLLAAVDTPGASAEAAVLGGKGSHKAGRDGVCCLPAGPAILRPGHDGNGETPTLLANDGTACTFRATPAGTSTRMAALALDKPANLTGDLPGRQLKPQAVSNNIGQAVRAASCRQKAFTIQPVVVTRLRTTFA